MLAESTLSEKAEDINAGPEGTWGRRPAGVRERGMYARVAQNSGSIVFSIA